MFTYKYPRPQVTTDIVVRYYPNQVLLIKRKNEPYKDCWALPGGFLNDNETLLECAKRELEEETGLKLTNLRFQFIADNPTRDPRGRTLSAVYYACVYQKLPLKPADDAIDCRWMFLEDIMHFDRIPLAFDHFEILSRVLQNDV